MADNRAHRTRAARRAVIVCILVVGSVVAAACSGDDGASTTTTTRPPATTPPTTTTPSRAAEQAPEPSWKVQVGSTGNDALQGVAGRQNAVVSIGSAEAAVTGPAGVTVTGGARGGRDVLVTVVGTDGKVRSIEQAGGERNEAALGVGSAQGTTITCGYTDGLTTGSGNGSEDAFCAPVDEAGALGRAYQQGGTEADRLHGAAMASDGGVGYAAGNTLGLFPGATDTTTGVLGSGDVLLWQVGPDGTPRWIRQFGTAEADEAHGVTTTADGDALVVGNTLGALDRQSRGGPDGFVARFDPTGLPRWVRQFGTAQPDSARAVATGGDAAQGSESFVVAGSTDGAAAPAVGGTRTTDSAPKLDGSQPAPTNAGGTDALLVAFNSSGEQVWAAQLGTEGTDEATGVAIDGQNVLVAGTTAGAIDSTGRPSAGGRDGFLAEVDIASGAVRWITQFGSPADEDVTGLTVTEDGLAVVSGSTTGQMADTPNAGGSDGFLIAFPLPSAGGSVASSL